MDKGKAIKIGIIAIALIGAVVLIVMQLFGGGGEATVPPPSFDG